ncbi:MAG: hypothetical protein HS113_10585 [Verrucomicrobiales bacterium]|nr:hypothetical protein [Verrucomicrobiales bacterium]
MTRDEAQALLQAYRPGTADAHDPVFAEALDLLSRDAALRTWFESQDRFDGAVRDRLRAVAVPDDLLSRLLTARGQPVRRRGAPVWRRALALAAAVALLLGLGLYGLRSPPDAPTALGAYRNHLAAWLRQFPTLEFESEQLSEVKAWLAARGVTGDLAVPKGLEKFPTIGCRRLDWQGRNASLICFMVDGEVMHLVVIAGPPLDGGAAGVELRHVRVGEFHTATWARDGTAYLLLTRAPAETLRRVLAG